MSDLIVSSSPHVRSSETTDGLMRDVIIALIPATLVGFYVFGIAAVFTVLVSILAAVCAEVIFQKITKRPSTISDGSAIVTGLLLGLNLPAVLPETPYLLGFWVPVLGSFFAIIIVKQLFGGLGYNFMNPALGARVFLLVSFAKHMTTWPALRASLGGDVDAVSTATVLGSLKEGNEITQTVFQSFIGTVSGCIGEVSALAILIGGIYLIARRVITYHIPLFYIATVAVFMALYALGTGQGAEYVGFQIFSGGLLLGAFFMATDYVSSPMTTKGKIIFGIGCGIITALIRTVGNYPEGVSFAIIIMNLTVPLIDRFTIPRAFGEEK